MHRIVDIQLTNWPLLEQRNTVSPLWKCLRHDPDRSIKRILEIFQGVVIHGFLSHTMNADNSAIYCDKFGLVQRV